MLEDYHIYKYAWVNKRAPHLSHKLSNNECQFLLKKGGFMVRNTYDFDADRETSFWYIIKDIFGGMDELSPKTRNCIRRALKTLDIRMIEKDLLLKEGYEVYLSAFERYKVKSEAMSQESFLSMIQSSPENYHFWGCIDKKTNCLIAFSINAIVDNTCNYLTMKVIPSYLTNYYPFYGLLFTMNQYYLEDLKLLYISDGSRSITEHSNIQLFLEDKFLFRKAYCRIRVYYKWWIRIIISALYPFKSLIPIQSLKAILYMESMQRSIKNT